MAILSATGGMIEESANTEMSAVTIVTIVTIATTAISDEETTVVKGDLSVIRNESVRVSDLPKS